MLRHRISPSPAPSPSPTSSSPSSSSSTQQQQTQSKPPVDFSPPLIAMVVIIVTAFIIITYSRLLSHHCLHTYRKFRRWRRRYVLSTSGGDIDSPPHHLFDEPFHVLSPYGLDESIIKTIPLSIYKARKSGFHDCAVCLLEFELNDYVRTLPICSHAFHVDCIDIWLRSHANCPLCRAGISPFTPLMAGRIRPSLDDIVIEIESNPIAEEESETENEIEVLEPNTRRNFLLKRSYSFGYERNLASEQVLGAVTASPYRKSFWNKRISQSPFTKHRVFSFRYYRTGMKSPLFLRRRSMSGLFYPLSESNGSSRRSKSSFASPMFMRPTGFSSSRLRSGDPEALLSPERYNRR